MSALIYPSSASAAFSCVQMLSLSAGDSGGSLDHPRSLSIPTTEIYSDGESIGLLRIVTAVQYQSLLATNSLLPTEIVAVTGAFPTQLAPPSIAGLLIDHPIRRRTHVENAFKKKEAIFAALEPAAFSTLKASEFANGTPIRITQNSGQLKIEAVSPGDIPKVGPKPLIEAPISHLKSVAHLDDQTPPSVQSHGQKFANLAFAKSSGDSPHEVFPDSVSFSFGDFFDFLDASRTQDEQALSQKRSDLFKKLKGLDDSQIIKTLEGFQTQILTSQRPLGWRKDTRLEFLKRFGPGKQTFRLRTSSPNEDSISAGLNESQGIFGDPADPTFELEIDQGSKKLYASFYSPRAYFTRRWFGLSEENQAIAFFAHPSVDDALYGGDATFWLGAGFSIVELNIYRGGETGTSPASDASFVRRLRFLKMGEMLNLIDEETNLLLPFDQAHTNPLPIQTVRRISEVFLERLSSMEALYKREQGPSPYFKTFSTEWLLRKSPEDGLNLVNLQFKISDRPEPTPEIQLAPQNTAANLTEFDTDPVLRDLQKKIARHNADWSSYPFRVYGYHDFESLEREANTSIYWIQYRGRRFAITFASYHQDTYPALLSFLKSNDPDGKILLGIGIAGDFVDHENRRYLSRLGIYHLQSWNKSEAASDEAITLIQALLLEGQINWWPEANILFEEESKNLESQIRQSLTVPADRLIPISEILKNLPKTEADLRAQIRADLWEQVRIQNQRQGTEIRLSRYSLEVYKNLPADTGSRSFYWISYRGERFLILSSDFHHNSTAALQTLLKALGPEAKLLFAGGVKAIDSGLDSGFNFVNCQSMASSGVSSADLLQIIDELTLGARTPYADFAEIQFDGTFITLEAALRKDLGLAADEEILLSTVLSH